MIITYITILAVSFLVGFIFTFINRKGLSMKLPPYWDAKTILTFELVMVGLISSLFVWLITNTYNTSAY